MSERVLVVDDNSTVRKIVRVVLEEAGYDVTDAIDGQQALDIVQRDSFSLALIDFVMPRLNGYQLAQAIRSIQHLRSLPIVLMSAKAEQIGERFMAQTGAVDAITKPFAPDAIVAVVSHALTKKNGKEQHTLMAEELNSKPSIVPPPPTVEESQAQEHTSTDIHALQQLKTTMSEIAAVAPLVQAQIEAAGRFAALTARALLPVVRGAANGSGEQITEQALADAFSRAMQPADLAALARELRTFESELRGPVALEGSVERVPLGEVLQLLRLQRQSGILVVQHRASEVVVAFREGNVDLAVARAVSHEFLLGRYLVADKIIERAVLDRVLAEPSGGGGWLGERLMRQGLITKDDLERALTRQTSEIIYEMLRWNVGWYRFEHNVMLPEAQSATLGLPIESMVLEGFRRVDEWRVIEQEVSSFDEVLARDESVIEAVGDRLAREEQVVLGVIDGRRTVRDVITSSALSSFDGCRILYRLLRSRLIRKRAA